MALSSYTPEQLARLRDMIAKGVLSLEQNGEKVTFRSLAEMTALEARMSAAIGETASAMRIVSPVFTRGRA